MTSINSYIRPEVVDYGDLLELTAAARFAQVAIPIGGSGGGTGPSTDGATGPTDTDS